MTRRHLLLRLAILTLTQAIGVCLCSSLGYNRAACQYPSSDPLDDCPTGTVFVGPSSNYTTIQAAVRSLPNDTTAHTILVASGNYTEQVNVTRLGPVTLLGQTAAPNDRTQNTVRVYWAAVAGPSDNARTSTLTVGPAGAPYASTDFRAYNLDFINDYAPYSDTPSLALDVNHSNASFYYTGFYSYQDTTYVGPLGNAYFYDSEIAGQTDFFYGYGTAWIQSSLVTLRSCGGGITAWKGTNTTFVNKYGVYIHDSAVMKENNSLSIAGDCALGRPWNAQIRSIYAHCYLDDSIRPAGYIEWQPTDPRIDFNTTMAEYHNFGPGFNLTGRIEGNVTLLMTEEEYEPYSSVEQVFQYPPDGDFGNVDWIDFEPWSFR